jgi:hypothetical protein
MGGPNSEPADQVNLHSERRVNGPMLVDHPSHVKHLDVAIRRGCAGNNVGILVGLSLVTP